MGVCREQEELWVWGATRHLPPFSLVLEVVAPGLLVIKHSRGEESGKFVNIAVIEGDRVKIIDERAARFPDCPALLYSLLGMESQFAADGSVSVLIQLAVSMREHGRGGLLLVVPANGAAVAGIDSATHYVFGCAAVHGVVRVGSTPIHPAL